jgi:gluconate:H+ symporter, GntP family
MLLVSIALGMAHGFGARQLIATLNTGFGGALGEYALILLPSFTMAAAVSNAKVADLPDWLPPLLAPFAGAAMVCPDTAYAALGPVAKRKKLSVLFGTYAGFKLLIPTGPVIVATGLGAFDQRLALAMLPVFAVAWATGLLFAHVSENGTINSCGWEGRLPWHLLMPLLLLVGLLVIGFVLRAASVTLPPAADFLVSPKGSLFAAAAAALIPLTREDRSEAVASSLKRSGPLLLTIGAASALGMMITTTLPIVRLASVLVGTGLILPSLFIFTAIFKLAKGSSMATFAGTTGIVAPLLPAIHVSPVSVTLAMCAGAFVTITPNDSLYWIVREDCGEGYSDLGRKLAIGGTLQGVSALAAVIALNAVGWI